MIPPLETYPKIHPFWRRHPSLRNIARIAEAAQHMLPGKSSLNVSYVSPVCPYDHKNQDDHGDQDDHNDQDDHDDDDDDHVDKDDLAEHDDRDDRLDHIDQKKVGG